MKPFAALFGASTFAVLALTVSPAARAADDPKVPPVDALFAREAAAMNQAEIQLGKDAADHATTPAVKQFAQKMVDDHTKAGDQLKNIVDPLKIDLPGDMDSAHNSFKSALDDLKGADYERAYVQAMVTDHALAITLFQDEAKNGNNAQLKAFAQQTLPILQQHETEVRHLEKTITKANAAKSND